MSVLPPLPVAAPLAVAALLAAIRDFIPSRVVHAIAMATAAAVTVISSVLFARSLDARIVYWFGGWQPGHGIAIGISFVIDPAGAGLATLSGFLVLAALVFSSRYFDPVRALYQVLMLGFLGAMCGFSLTGDLFNLFVFFELMSAAAFALCGYKTEERGPLQGALNFAVTNTVGAFLALSGVGLLYGRTGALNMAQIGNALAGQADSLVIVAFLFLLAGFLVKAAVVPFHFWLADAHAVAPTPVCVLFSGVMVELGLYAIVRIYWTIFAGPLGQYAPQLRNVLAGAAVASALLGGLMCFAQRNLKRLLAFSTVSHMGLMVLGFAMLTPGALAGAGIYVLGHAMTKSSLFLCAGILLHRFATVDEMQLRGRGRAREPALWVTAATFLLNGLGLAGLPPFGTFLGRSLIDESAAKLGYSWTSYVLIAAEVLTGAAVLRAAGRIFGGWCRNPQEEEEKGGKVAEGEETEGGHDRVPVPMVVSALVLMLLGLAATFVPDIAGVASASAGVFEDQRAYISRVLYGAPDPAPVHETHEPLTSGLVRGLATPAAAVLLAVLALSRGEQVHGTFEAAVGPLRALHSGHVGDYIAWLMVGVALFGGFFMVLFR